MRIFIGTSGWTYYDWNGVFYPEDLPTNKQLEFYSKVFKTVEINYSFYHLPRPLTYENWYKAVPNDFVFAVKASRFITHIKRLKGVKEAWEKFFKNVIHLKEKLGPILFQFPPNFKVDLKRFEDFLSYLSPRYRYAFEFRHPSWASDHVYKLMKMSNVAWVIADSPRYPKVDVITAGHAYIRMHGSTVLFGSKYTDDELNGLAKNIKRWKKDVDAIYVYFNNDFHGYAVEDAKRLLELV